jgi:hypothetical protein
MFNHTLRSIEIDVRGLKSLCFGLLQGITKQQTDYTI